jgi:hypothetical protein
MSTAAAVKTPSYSIPKLVQRHGYFAVKTDQGWDYYPIGLDGRSEGEKILYINKYNGPIADGIVIRRNGLAFVATATNIARGKILKVSERKLADLQALYPDPEVAEAVPPTPNPWDAVVGVATPQPEIVLRPGDPVMRAATAQAEAVRIERIPGTARPVEAPVADSDVADALARVRARFPELNT